jgi:hypothetical protein
MAGNNVLIFSQMTHDRLLGNRVVSLHVLKILHQKALVATVLFDVKVLL